MRIITSFMALALTLAIHAVAGEIICEANGFAGHLQGIAADATGIYWSFYDTVVKTDYTGKTLTTVKNPRHAGDLCAVDGKIYVSTVYYDSKMAAEEGGTGWLYIYNADLVFEKKVALPKTPRPDGITFLNGKFYIAGDDFGKESHPLNTISVYDANLNFERNITIDIGKETKYGAQTLNAMDGRILAGFYCSFPNAYSLELPELKTADSFPLSVNVGMAVVPSEISAGRKIILVARLTGQKGDCGGRVLVYEMQEGKPVLADFTPAMPGKP